MALEYQEMVAEQARVRKVLEDYDGAFSFMLKMRQLASDPDYIFSQGMIDAIDRSAAYNQPKSPETDELVIDRLEYGTHYFAVDGEAQTAFLRIDRPEDGKWKDWHFVKILSGPEEIRMGSQRPGGGYRGQNPNLVEQVNINPVEAMARYGREIGRCGYCNLRLTDEVSRAFGIGPICRGRLGV